MLIAPKPLDTDLHHPHDFAAAYLQETIRVPPKAELLSGSVALLNGYYARFGVDLSRFPGGLAPYEWNKENVDILMHAPFWLWTMAKDANGKLYIGHILQIEGYTPFLAFLSKIVTTWPKHKFANVRLDKNQTEPLPDFLRPTKLEHIAPKRREAMLRQPAEILTIL